MARSCPALLAVDDHPGILAMIRGLLEDRFEVVVRQDAVTLVEDFERLDPVVVLLDIDMPKIDGLTAARQLRAVHPEARIVFLSADSSTATMAAAREAGGCGFVMKTYAASILIPALEAALQSSTG